MVGNAAFSSTTDQYTTAGGVRVWRTVEELPVAGAIDPLIGALDSQRGVLLASSYEYPGRYTRWDMGFVNPPLSLTAHGRQFALAALNARGAALLPGLAACLERVPAVAALTVGEGVLAGTVAPPDRTFTEEERSRQPSIFSVLRALVALFYSSEDPHLGLYGAFGYDLAFQFEPIRLRLPRPATQRDLVLYLPDELIVVDHRRERAMRRRYEFVLGGHSTAGLPRDGEVTPFVPDPEAVAGGDHAPGEYAATVRRAREAFARGDLFEVVPSQTFFEPCPAPPSALFRRLRERNPAPYGFLINLGQREYLVGASPEMYVRVEGTRVETCPISGTIARGRDPIADAAQILALLNSEKDAAELTMCTDVDRNDKSRVCRPGSVRVIGRRQIELYSRLIHTVDHVEGHLREGFDALDAFLAHTWAVTVTGAPKTWAMQFIEDHERSPRAWYGGAVGLVAFNGNLNTGLTLRTIRVRDGRAEVRVGATLLYDSDPEEEERETRLKASAFLDALRRPSAAPPAASAVADQPGAGRRILLVDHQDSFVHTLANYLRQTGAEVVTLRAGFPAEAFDRLRPDLVVLSPGPGTPADFRVAETLAAAVARALPVFGVCLGLQGLVEYCGGSLATLPYPMHGKASRIRVLGGRLFTGLPRAFQAARYHSLYAVRETLPPVLEVTAESDDGVVMAVEHRALPLAAVQFHPESILTLEDDCGLRLIRNVVALLARQPAGATPAARA
ncbi:MAG: anthranilate synthase component I [Chloroflexi bacterium]|nr:anthranilate synthase component I [Chloroflexota bacterium]